MQKSFSQLKKDLKVGVKVKTITNNLKPDFNGEIREISIVQTNVIAFKCVRNGKEVNSWYWWGKTKDYEYEDNIFKCYDENHNLEFEYEIM